MPQRLSPETLRLYAIFGPQDLAEGWTAAGLAEAVLRGGATCLQWRDKTALACAPLTERVNACAPVLEAARAAGALLLINDDVDLAAALQAFEAALRINPHLDQAVDVTEQLRKRLRGQAL